jgi:membrane-bound lytic murein transglycosylase D
VPEIPKMEMIATQPKIAEPLTLKENNPAPVELKQIENQAKAVLGNDTLKEEIAETKSEQKESEDVEIEIVSEPSTKIASVVRTEPVAIASTNSNLGNDLIAPAKPGPIVPAVVEMPKEENGEIMVTQGMSSYKISRHYKKHLESLYTWNSGSNRILNPGQKIKIARSGPKTESIKVYVPVQNSETYEVKTGDTAYKIAQKFGMKIDDFLSMNQKEDAALKIGEVVKVAKSK